VGFTLESAPQPTVLVRPLSNHIAATHRPTAATRSVSFRPRGSSPPRRFTPHSACQFIAPDYRQGFATSAPIVPAEAAPIRASGDASPSKEMSRRIARIAARTTTGRGVRATKHRSAQKQCSYIPPLRKGLVACPLASTHPKADTGRAERVGCCPTVDPVSLPRRKRLMSFPETREILAASRLAPKRHPIHRQRCPGLSEPGKPRSSSAPPRCGRSRALAAPVAIPAASPQMPKHLWTGCGRCLPERPGETERSWRRCVSVPQPSQARASTRLCG